MMPRLNSDSWDGDGNLLVPRYGIRIAMGLALFAAAGYCSFEFLVDMELRKLYPLQPSEFPDSLRRTIQWMLSHWCLTLFLDCSSLVEAKKPRAPKLVLQWRFPSFIAIFDFCVGHMVSWAKLLRPAQNDFQLDVCSVQRLGHGLWFHDCAQGGAGAYSSSRYLRPWWQ